MALVLADRVKETTTTTGTGTYTLAGAADSSFETFAQIGDGNTTYYACTDGTDFEVGIGTYTASGTTLARTTILQSSNSDSAVNWGAGTKDIFCTQPAEKAVYLDASGYAAAFDGRNITNVDAETLDSINSTSFLRNDNGDIAAGSNKITNVTNPVDSQDAATKAYVDSVASAAIHIHDPVRLESPASAGNLTVTYNNGSSGVGATLTNAGTQVALSIDGVATVVDDRVLIYNQTDATQNGVYTVTNIGSGSTNWVLTRATDADSAGTGDATALDEGSYFYVEEGNEGAGDSYVCNTSGTIVFGTTDITFAKFSTEIDFTGGTGIDIDVRQINLDLSELTTSTSNGDGDFFAVVDTSNNQKKLTKGNIALSGFNNDSGFLTGNQTITLSGDLSGSGTTSIDATINASAFQDIDIEDGFARTLKFDNLEKSNITSDGMMGFDSSQGLLVYRTQQGTNGTVTVLDGANVDAGTGISITNTGTGGTGTDPFTFSLSTAGAGSGTYGSTDDSTKIDTITLDAYGRVTAVATGSTGDITAVTAGSGLTGGGTAGGVTLTIGAGTLIDVAADSVNVDLSELTTSTSDGDGDFFVVVDGANAQKKLTKANINLSGFNNNSGFITGNETITLSGDITGSGTTSISTTIAANSVALGTQTTGSYVESLVAGNLIDLQNNSGEGATPTIDVDLSELTTSTSNGDGDFFAVVDSANAQKKLTKANIALSGFNNDSGFITSSDDISGNAATATALATARNFSLTGDVTAGAVSFDGTGNVALSTTIAANSVALGTDTTGNYVSSLVAGNLIDLQNNSGESATPTIDVDLSELTTSTTNADGSFFAVVDGTNVQRKLTKSNINLSGFNNDSGFITSADGGNAATLDGLDSTQFLRSDASDNYTSGTLTFNSGTQLKLTSNTSIPVLDIDGSGPNFIRFTDNGSTTDAVNIVYRTTPHDLRIERSTDDSIIAEFGGDDGHAALFYDNNLKINTTSTGAEITGDLTVTSTDDGATADPEVILYRNSASPADGDVLANIDFTGNNSAGTSKVYGSLQAKITDVTSGTEDANFAFRVMSGGTLTNVMNLKGNGDSQILANNLALMEGVNLKFEGATNNGFETTLTVTDPTADRTLTLQDASGTIALTSDIPGTSSDVQFNSFGVGTAASETTGEIRATADITSNYSDERLKNIHGTIPNALDKVKSLGGYYFTENETAKSLGYNNDAQQVGVIAQEVEKVLPEAVKPAPIDDKYLTVQYEKMVPLLIEAMKEQQAKIEELEARLANLEA